MARKKFYLDIGAGTDVGCVRTQNEDNYIIRKPATRRQRTNKGYLLAVCDGMGGALGGRAASTKAVNAIEETFYDVELNDPNESLVFAIQEANKRIHKASIEHPDLRGMGTTTVAVAMLGNHAYIAHVGDSRCYLVRGGAISPLTQDHTVVNKMVREGLITKEQARTHPESHILNRSVGVSPSVEIEIQRPLPLRAGDKVILCSDGLTGPVVDEEILEIVDSHDPQRAVNHLINLARNRGGPDNITVLVASIRTTPPPSQTSTKTVMREALRLPKKTRGWLLAILLLTAIALGTVGYLFWTKQIDLDPVFDSIIRLMDSKNSDTDTE